MPSLSLMKRLIWKSKEFCFSWFYTYLWWKFHENWSSFCSINEQNIGFRWISYSYSSPEWTSWLGNFMESISHVIAPLSWRGPLTNESIKLKSSKYHFLTVSYSPERFHYMKFTGRYKILSVSVDILSLGVKMLTTTTKENEKVPFFFTEVIDLKIQVSFMISYIFWWMFYETLFRSINEQNILIGGFHVPILSLMNRLTLKFHRIHFSCNWTRWLEKISHQYKLKHDALQEKEPHVAENPSLYLQRSVISSGNKSAETSVTNIIMSISGRQHVSLIDVVYYRTCTGSTSSPTCGPLAWSASQFLNTSILGSYSPIRFYEIELRFSIRFYLYLSTFWTLELGSLQQQLKKKQENKNKNVPCSINEVIDSHIPMIKVSRKLVAISFDQWAEYRFLGDFMLLPSPQWTGCFKLS